MKNLKFLFLILFAITLYNCDEDQFESDLKYVSFENDLYSTGVDVNGTETVTVKVFSSTTENSDRTFNIQVDPSSNAANGSYQVPTSVTIPAGTNEGSFAVQLSDVDLGIGVNNLVLSFTNDDVISNHNVGPTTTIAYIQNCNEINVTLDIVFDGYGSETSWEITDALGGVVASKNAGTYSDGQANASESFTLCIGRDYTFTIKDSYGDGLSYPANGTYTLKVDGTTVASGGGDFGSSESTDFDTK